MASKPKTIVAINYEKPAPVFPNRFMGAVVLAGFILTWVTSAFSPFLLVAACWTRNYAGLAIIFLVTVASYTPWKPGPISQFLKDLINTYHPQYYDSCKVIYEEELPARVDNDDRKRQPIFYAVHPHGVFNLGWAHLFTTPDMDHVRFCFSKLLLLSPFFRLFSRCVGRPGSADKADMIRYMKQGQDIALPIGGFEEATISSLYHDRVYVQKRTGFIRLCLQYGYAIRPAYAFGEKSTFWNLQGFWDIRFKLNRNSIPTIFICGQPWFPLLPKHKADLRIVVGVPLRLPQIAEPTKEDIKLWHGKYVAAMNKIFEDYKEEAYGSERAKTAKLEIW